MSQKTQEIIEKAEKLAEPLFKIIDNDIALYNQKKVLNAFREHRVATRHFPVRPVMVMMTLAEIRFVICLRRYLALRAP